MLGGRVYSDWQPTRDPLGKAQEGTPGPSLTIAKATIHLNSAVPRRVMHLRDQVRALEKAPHALQPPSPLH